MRSPLRTLALATVLLFPFGEARGQSLGLEVGQPLPALELPTLDGRQTVRLSELRGTALLLIQFASW